MRAARVLAALLVLLPALAAGGVREPVLKQVALPHAYYWRELYLPQLTTGPSSADFTPDGRSVVYSMAGSLWIQRLGTDTARELTAGPGYDYQPDVSPDGRHVVFARHHRDAIELVELELESGRERALTQDGAVAVEPRYSPDGRRVLFASSREAGRFTLYVLQRDGQGVPAPQRLFAEQRSPLPRYYYSPFDHAINGSWDADGGGVYFVSNRAQAWGSGDLWHARLDAPEAWTRVLSEETTWSARPELSPDGRRLLYASYEGRQWHQLWLATPRGETPLPLTFGEFDRREGRWSPDGTRVLYISNESGNTTLWVQEVMGGERRQVVAQKREWLKPMQVLGLRTLDEAGKPVAARLSVLGADGRHHAPVKRWMRADDGFDRSVQEHETHYFHCPGECAVAVPRGTATITAQAGFARRPVERRVRIDTGDRFEDLVLAAHALPAEWGAWTSLDQHVHMNYGGHYRNTGQTLAEAARAEDLDVVYNLVVNKEQRVPDIALFRPEPEVLDGVTLVQAQEFHTSYWGHLGLLHLDSHLLTPDFSAYRHTALASPWPHNGVVADLAHRQGALVGYVHPFDWPIDPAREAALTHALPADVAHGKIDYLEIVSFAEHRATAGVWHRLLNLGFRLPAGAGTDAMANYASLRGPVGLNRVFLNQADRSPAALARGMREGRGFVSNGPLLGFALDGRTPGDTIALPAGGSLPFRLSLRSPVPVERVEIVANGQVVAAFAPGGDGGDWSGRIPLARSGWVLARAEGKPSPLLLDMYPYATTNPVWVEVAGAPARSPEDARYFVAWLDRVIADAGARDDWNTPRERDDTLQYLRAARARFVAMQ